jgi:hypothetical protein
MFLIGVYNQERLDNLIAHFYSLFCVNFNNLYVSSLVSGRGIEREREFLRPVRKEFLPVVYKHLLFITLLWKKIVPNRA